METGALNRAVQRNAGRFPADFMFQLNAMEWENLKCQIGISRWGGDRALPYAFTEQGVAMLSGVLSSPRAIEVNVAIMRAFVKFREVLGISKELTAKLNELERRVSGQDENIRNVFKAIRSLMEPRTKPKKKIGFSGGA